MKIIVSKSDLTESIAKVIPFIERKSTLPILANVLIETVPDRDADIKITGTNLDHSLTVGCMGRVLSKGKIAVPARKLSDVLAKIKGMAESKVELSSDDMATVTVKCGGLTVTLPGMKADNYPVVDRFPADTDDKAKYLGTYPAGVLSGLIARTSYAISGEESRFTLNGALLELRADLIRMVATDGHRCAIAEYGLVPEVTGKVLLPRAGIERLSVLVRDEKYFIDMARDESKVYFRCDNGGWEMCTRVLTGQFPNWDMIVPKPDSNRIKVVLPVQGLKQVLGTVAGFADERSHATKWELVPNQGIRISASNTDTGTASQIVTVDCEDTVAIGLSAEHVMNILDSALSVQSGKQAKESLLVRLEIKDGQSAVAWVPAESIGWSSKCVLMPMRV
jgi:DNA polymerase III subunit beta